MHLLSKDEYILTRTIISAEILMALLIGQLCKLNKTTNKGNLGQ